MRKQLSKKNIKEFLMQTPAAQGIIDKKSQVIQQDDKLLVDNNVVFRLHNNKWVPSLDLLRTHKILPTITVDQGTPPFIAKGADLMRPGVVSCEEFSENHIVTIIDEKHKFPIAVGIPLFSSKDLMDQSSGKVVKIIFNLTN